MRRKECFAFFIFVWKWTQYKLLAAFGDGDHRGVLLFIYLLAQGLFFNIFFFLFCKIGIVKKIKGEIKVEEQYRDADQSAAKKPSADLEGDY